MFSPSVVRLGLELRNSFGLKFVAPSLANLRSPFSSLTHFSGKLTQRQHVSCDLALHYGIFTIPTSIGHINTGTLNKMGHPDCKLLVVCGPSGSGKSSLLTRLFDEYPNEFGFSVSHTTRNPRPGEVDGLHYHFSTREKMEEGIVKGLFLESAIFSNNFYGTSLQSVESVCQSGKVCVLDIDMEGVKQVKTKDLDLILIFIKPPSMEVLEKRLRDRGTETEDSLKRRLNAASAEIAYGEIPGNFNIIITNDDLEKSYSQFKQFILQELAKRNINL